MERKTHGKAIAAGIALLSAITLWHAYFYGAAALFYGLQQWQAAPATQSSIELSRYRAVVQAKPLSGVEKNLSGLTFDTHTGTLFGIANAPSRIVQLTTEGEVLRVIPVRGGKDTEGITHLGDHNFMVVDEKKNTLWLIEITPQTEEVSLEGASHLVLQLDPLHKNLGIEAMSWSERNQTLWVGQEKWPMHVQELAGEPLAPTHESAAEQLVLHPVREWSSFGLGGWLIRDLASMTHMEENDHLLMLSQESGVVVEYTVDGEPLSLLPLWRGRQGLKEAIPQPEGLTVDPQGNLYIVSEPNLFYRFEKLSQPSKKTTPVPDGGKRT